MQAELVLDSYNQRIKVMNFSGPFSELVYALRSIARKENIGKIIVYTPSKKNSIFEVYGYKEEGRIIGYYSGKTCILFSKFSKKKRAESLNKENEDRVLRNCLLKSAVLGKKRKIRGNKKFLELPEGYVLRPAVQADAHEMASFYRKGFSFYPTPLHRESYLLEAMESSVIYMLAENKGKIISLASAETDPETRSAEITDCLTAPSERGNGLVRILISFLEMELIARNFKTAYTLCRALPPGVNKIFSSLGYTYTGRLVNNCRIGEGFECMNSKIEDGFEDMNIWCKELLSIPPPSLK